MTDQTATTRGGTGRGELSPLLKILLWAAGVVALGGVVQAAGLVLGVNPGVFSRDEPEIMLTFALVGLILLAKIDNDPDADFGLAFNEKWPGQLMIGLGLGIGIFLVVAIVLVATGAMGPSHDASWVALIGVIWFLPVMLLKGFFQQVIFSGFLLDLIRSRNGWGVAIILVALIFAFLQWASQPWLMVTELLPKFIGFALLGVFLGLLRVVTGSIMMSGGVFAGLLLVDRLNRESDLARQVLDVQLAGVLAPQRDLFRSPIFWGLMTAGIIIAFVVLARRGAAPRPKSTAEIPTSLKRVYPLGMINAMAPLDLWFSRLAQCRWQIPLMYWPRLLATLVISATATIVCLPERLLLPLVLRFRRAPSPVFIVGVPRSGTTHLHNLLALDPSFVTARNYQVMNPHGFLFLGWLLVPVIAAFMPWRRPMDKMRMGIFTPNEEEFAITNLCKMSPMWGTTFPREWPYYERFIFPDRLPEADASRWKREYLRFLKKLTFFTRRRPVLKNPYNTGRVALLSSMFPEAKFIHIHRHPFSVYRSNIHLAREGHCLMQLQEPEVGVSYESRFLANYRAMTDAFYRDAAERPPGQLAEIRFEDLERDAVLEIRRLYEELGLEFSPRFEARLRRYVQRHADYQKNPHADLPENVQAEVVAAMSPQFDRWHYDVGE